MNVPNVVFLNTPTYATCDIEPEREPNVCAREFAVVSESGVPRWLRSHMTKSVHSSTTTLLSNCLHALINSDVSGRRDPQRRAIKKKLMRQ
jgi:hypothetical protein